MLKAWTEYQELVALVAKALDREAIIKTGQWIEGPDGDREVDVAVRGIVDGTPHFVHIESLGGIFPAACGGDLYCKDWNRPVEWVIEEISTGASVPPQFLSLIRFNFL